MTLTARGLAALGFIACFQAMTWACGSRAPTPAPSPSPPSAAQPPGQDTAGCAVITGPGEPVTTVALNESVEPSNALHPTNESERLLFRQLYDTLVRADCNGRVGPGLAASWKPGGDERIWIVALRDDARFSDGTPVTAADVRASWTRQGSGDELRPHVNRLVQSVDPIGERVLAITLRSRRVDVPMALAHPDLAIARSVPGSPWPLGTRSGRVAPETSARAAAGTTVITVARDDRPAIRFLVAPGDPRDVLDEGVDLLLTRDPSALDYAATLRQFQSVPLAWQRTHVLLMPGRSGSSPWPSDEARQVLADDAVRGEARGARSPFWWQVLPPECEVPAAPGAIRVSLTPQVVYDGRDGAARDLAERFVGVARASGPAAAALLDAIVPDRPRRAYQRATGLTGEPLAAAWRRGTDAGYVMALDSRPLDPCRDLQVLIEGAPWLDPGTIVPLVETRMHAVLRRGRTGVTVEWDGGLVIAGMDESR